MKIVNLSISEITPYENNARLHDRRQLEVIKKSIEDFGMNDPIGVWSDKNIIVEGHGRLEACKELGFNTVPCIRLDHLSDDERKAYTLVHNKSSDLSGWDFTLLDSEIENIDGFDMGDFGFEMPSFEEGVSEEKENERTRTVNGYNLESYDEGLAVGFYQMPYIRGIDYVPEDLIGFNYMLSSDDYSKGIHFYIDDYQFERVWNEPLFYIEKMKKYDCVLSPDFSLYSDMPMAMKIWNVYRSRLIGQLCQKNGIKVIPTVSWCEEDTFEFCFDGLPQYATLSISTIGVKNKSEAFGIWKKGVDELIDRLKPVRLLVYGGEVEYDYGNIEVIYYNNKVTERMKKIKEEE